MIMLMFIFFAQFRRNIFVVTAAKASCLEKACLSINSTCLLKARNILYHIVLPRVNNKVAYSFLENKVFI